MIILDDPVNFSGGRFVFFHREYQGEIRAGNNLRRNNNLRDLLSEKKNKQKVT